jgi:hypothetical protein
MTLQLCQLLRDKIKAFIEARNESIRWFGRQTDVDYTTVYRLLNGEQKTISLINAKKILAAVEPSSLVSILGEYYPDEMRQVLEETAAEIEKQASIFETILKDVSLLKVYTLVATAPHMSRGLIERRFGQDGLEQLDKLVSLGAVSEANGLVDDSLQGKLLVSDEAIKLHAKCHADLVNLSKPGTHAYNTRVALNEAGLKAWYEAQVEHERRLQQIEQDEDLKGDCVLISSSVSGPL